MLIDVVFAISANATKPGHFEFDCDCNIEIIGTPELNVPFDAILTWTPRVEVCLSRNIRDTVHFWRAYEHMRYISGDTLWIGNFEKDKTYSMKATFEVVDYGYCMVVAKIISARVKQNYLDPAIAVDSGFYEERICRSNRLKLEALNKDTEISRNAQINWHYTDSGDSVSIQPFSSEKLNFGLPPATVKASGMTPLIGEVGPRRINDADTIIVRIHRASILERLPLALSSLRIYKMICPDDVSSIEIDTACVKKFEKISNNAVIVDRPQKECSLNLIMNDSLYLVPIEIVR